MKITELIRQLSQVAQGKLYTAIEWLDPEAVVIISQQFNIRKTNTVSQDIMIVKTLWWRYQALPESMQSFFLPVSEQWHEKIARCAYLLVAITSRETIRKKQALSLMSSSQSSQMLMALMLILHAQDIDDNMTIDHMLESDKVMHLLNKTIYFRSDTLEAAQIQEQTLDLALIEAVQYPEQSIYIRLHLPHNPSLLHLQSKLALLTRYQYNLQPAKIIKLGVLKELTELEGFII